MDSVATILGTDVARYVEMIDALAQKMFIELLMHAFNSAIVTLSVLLHFPMEHLHVPALMTWELSDIPLWQKCLADLKGAPPWIRQPLRSLKLNRVRVDV